MIETIEKLLKDKRELGNTLSSLHGKQEDFQKALDREKKALEAKFEIDLQRNKEAWMASEKVRV
jgi:hypothetical protein